MTKVRRSAIIHLTLFGKPAMNKSERQEQQLDVRQAILKTALALINEKGLDKLSLREIARRIEYSPAGLYEYFESKLDILRTLAREGEARLVTMLRQVPDDLEPGEQLIRVWLAYVDFIVHSSEYFVVMNSVPSTITSLDQPPPEGSSYEIFLRTIQNALDVGAITAGDEFTREEILYSLWSMAHGMGMLQLTNLRNMDADFASTNRKALGTFIDGLK